MDDTTPTDDTARALQVAREAFDMSRGDVLDGWDRIAAASLALAEAERALTLQCEAYASLLQRYMDVSSTYAHAARDANARLHSAVFPLITDRGGIVAPVVTLPAPPVEQN